MPLEKNVIIDRIEILESGVIQVRTKTTIFDDGVEISASLHRHIVEPGADYSNENDRVKQICSVIYTQSLIDQYQAKKATQIAEVVKAGE
jgi:hypothetical protein